MRWFIVFLLIANILLFLWVQQETLRPPAHSDIPPPEIGTLRLRNEPAAPEAAVAPMTPARPDDPVTVSTVEADRQTVADDQLPVTEADIQGPATGVSSGSPEPPRLSESPVPAESTAPAEPGQVDGEPVTGVPEPVVASPVSTQEGIAALPFTATDAEPVPASEPTSEPEPAPEPEPVAMPTAPPEEGVAAPMPDEVGTVDTDQVPSAILAEVVSKVPAMCVRVGPFQPADADALLQKLPSNIELLADTSEEQTVADGYYVLIPALPDRAKGLSKLQELSEAGFNDTWLFRRGAYRNAISLGLFRRQAGAKRHADNVADKGFDVEVRERKKKAERRWLEFKQQGDDAISSALPLPDDVVLSPQDCP